jgi:hypothetical protein
MTAFSVAQWRPDVRLPSFARRADHEGKQMLRSLALATKIGRLEQVGQDIWSHVAAYQGDKSCSCRTAPSR